MEGATDIINAINGLRSALLNNQSDYCETQEACRIIGVNNIRALKHLNDKGVLTRYPREGKRFVYKKTECYKVAALLDNKTITL